jgi:hypothetical protein
MRLKLLILVGLAMACGLLSLPASAGLPGSLDSTFGTGGFTVTDFSGAWDEAVGVAVGQDGSVLGSARFMSTGLSGLRDTPRRARCFTWARRSLGAAPRGW